MSRTICLYLHAHQPFRIRPYSVFDAGTDSNYWNESDESPTSNRAILQKVADKSYRPTNAILLELLTAHPEFRLSLSITGTLLEQLEQWAPDALDSFRALVATGRVEIVAETYHHSLAFFYNQPEFEAQVAQHTAAVKTLLGVTPKAFRNTELSYNNDLAQWAEAAGYTAIITEGWEPILGWRSANFIYRPIGTKHIRLLLKNYKLSDDVAFRFSDRNWAEWPLTASKYAHWLATLPEDQHLINLFMDYETFGEHQWNDHGIFDFLRHFPDEFLRHRGNTFATISEAAEKHTPVDEVDVPHVLTWADTERDLTAWTGNAMQRDAIQSLYALQKEVLATKNDTIIQDWRRLQTSDHFYYMCTKWFNDGDVHAYFSPYQSPYDAFIYFSNALRDLRLRLLDTKRSGGA
jgi:alpha-amylase